MHERQKQRQHPHLAGSDSSTFDMIVHFKHDSRRSKECFFCFFSWGLCRFFSECIISNIKLNLNQKGSPSLFCFWYVMRGLCGHVLAEKGERCARCVLS